MQLVKKEFQLIVTLFRGNNVDSRGRINFQIECFVDVVSTSVLDVGTTSLSDVNITSTNDVDPTFVCTVL